jgi:membrane protein YdbS with pleckstrin-like domain
MPDIFVFKKARLPAPTPLPVQKTEKLSDPSLVTLFSNFTENPSNISFHHREEDEKILLFLRSHLITNLRWVLILFISALIPPLIFFLGTNNLPFPSLPARFTTIFILIYYLLLFAYAFSNFLTWFFNIFVITKKRIVDIDFNGLLHKETSYAKLNQIQDVSPKIIGFFGTFFHFGNVYVQTAAEKPEFEFHHVEKPDMVAQEILEQVRHEEREAPGEIA